jgi:hypothetical protein
VCPFCGNVNDASVTADGPCPRCTMEDTPATRQATKSRIGPWYVLQTRNPSAPGMKFSTLLALVARGQVTARSIVRGPTTHQLWRFAGHVRGLSREFLVCYSCGEPVSRTDTLCGHCERSQEPPSSPDSLLESRDGASVAPTNGAAHPTGAGSPGNGAPPRTRNREYELPSRPAAYAPSPQAHRGEHAERIRSLHGNAGRVPEPPQLIPHRGRAELHRRDPAVLSAMELASALHPGVETVEERPSVFKRFVLTLLVIGLFLAGLALYLRPEYRAKALAWTRAQFDRAQARVDRIERPKQTTQNAAVPDDRQIAMKASQEPTPPSGLQTSSAPPVPAPATQPQPPPATAPASADAAKADENGKRRSVPKDQTKSEARNQASKTADPESDARVAADAQRPDANKVIEEPMTLDAAIEKSRTLRKQALEAESRADWRSAARLYQEIERLPKAAWPADLKLRLDFAKSQSQ